MRFHCLQARTCIQTMVSVGNVPVADVGRRRGFCFSLADDSVGWMCGLYDARFDWTLQIDWARALMHLRNCCNFHDFRRLARRRLPGPIFDYIDGAAEDEVTHRRNTKSFESCDLVPHVLRGVQNVDLSVTVIGQKLALPVYCSHTALQRLFHHQGERAVAAAAAKYGTMFGVSSLGR